MATRKAGAAGRHRPSLARRGSFAKLNRGHLSGSGIDVQAQGRWQWVSFLIAEGGRVGNRGHAWLAAQAGGKARQAVAPATVRGRS